MKKERAFFGILAAIIAAVLISVHYDSKHYDQKPTPGTVAVLGTPPTTPPQLTDQQKIDLLRTEAHKRGLKWHIFCTTADDPNIAFQAEAVTKGAPFTFYIEEGSRGIYAVDGPSQAEAASRLTEKIISGSIYPAEHQQSHKKLCPPELRGE